MWEHPCLGLEEYYECIPKKVWVSLQICPSVFLSEDRSRDKSKRRDNRV